MPIITCQQPGCSNHIHYCKDDIEVHLYCEKHRTEEGRHSRTRILAKPKPSEPPTPEVIMRCINVDCHHKINIPKSEWMSGVKLGCPMCHGKLVYHGDVHAPQ